MLTKPIPTHLVAAVLVLVVTLGAYGWYLQPELAPKWAVAMFLLPVVWAAIELLNWPGARKGAERRSERVKIRDCRRGIDICGGAESGPRRHARLYPRRNITPRDAGDHRRRSRDLWELHSQASCAFIRDGVRAVEDAVPSTFRRLDVRAGWPGVLDRMADLSRGTCERRLNADCSGQRRARGSAVCVVRHDTQARSATRRVLIDP